MITEIIELFDMLRQLVQRKSELDKEYFENFIQPIWQSFNTVHRNYVDSFLKCKNILDSNEMQIERVRTSLAQLLENDSIIHSDERRELNQMVESIPAGTGKVKYELLSKFMEEINRYFVGPDWRSLRFVLEGTLYRLNKNEGNLDSIRYAVMGMLRHAQEKYDDVANKYYLLKKELLT